MYVETAESWFPAYVYIYTGEKSSSSVVNKNIEKR